MIESVDTLTNELVYPNELHNDENMKKNKITTSTNYSYKYYMNNEYNY
jgi:hypothetical protein